MQKKKFLQIFHLSLIATCFPLYGILIQFSEKHDQCRKIIDPTIAILSITWIGIVLIFTIISGNKNSFLNSLLSNYRELLIRPLFLYVSNIVLLFVIIFLCYQLIVFRQITFKSTYYTKIVDNSSPGKLILVANLKPNVDKKVRIKIGKHAFAFYQNDSQKLGGSLTIKIPPWWRNSTNIFIDVKLRENQFIEIIKPEKEDPSE
jgi:hypothetical protein